jgi:hypothetical protein
MADTEVHWNTLWGTSFEPISKILDYKAGAAKLDPMQENLPL